MKRRALYINGGGSLIQDVTSRRSLWYFLFTLRAAKARGCRVMMYGCGIGPVTRERGVAQHEKDAQLERRRHNPARAGLRGGARALRRDEAGDYPRRRPGADARAAPARRGGQEPSPRAGLPPGTRCAGFALRHWPGFSEKAPAIADCASYLYEKHGLTPVFIPINHKSD